MNQTETHWHLSLDIKRQHHQISNDTTTMKIFTTTTAGATTGGTKLFPFPSILLLLSFIVFSIFSISHLLSSSSFIPNVYTNPNPNTDNHPRLKVYVFPLPRSLSYGLLDQYWSLSTPDSRIPSDPDHDGGSDAVRGYPENPVIKQYSAEYWLLGDLETREEERKGGGSVAVRVERWEDADVVFVPFFAALSAEMELGWGSSGKGGGGGFGKRGEENGDYVRQKEVVDRIVGTDAWRRSGGRDHVFVLTDPVAMWHVRKEISPAILLVVDFGGWYKLDSISSDGNISEKIGHTQVSLIKDVIVPYTHLLPRLTLAEDRGRDILLYFKGAKHRHRGGQVREKLWDMLVNEPDVIMEEGFPDATGREQSIKGMQSSEFCLHPAGDTPTSCRLFDAISSLCIPVIVSDNIELPFEGVIDYKDFSVFVSVNNALKPTWLVNHLRSISEEQRYHYRANLARVQSAFEYDNGSPTGKGPIPPDGAVNHIWMKIYQKLPMIKETVTREKRKPEDVSIPLRCHCA